MDIRTARPIRVLLLAAASCAVPRGPAAAQDAQPPHRTEQVGFQNPLDGMPLSATLSLPPGDGPFPGVVLLSIADVAGIEARLVGAGYAVIRPERRGMTATDRLLQATYQDLANDARAAAAYLAGRPEVDGAAVGLVGQGDDSPAAALAAVESPTPAFLVLISTNGLPGAESFALEQRGLATERRWEADELAELDGFVERLVEIVLDERSPSTREARLVALLDAERGLPRSAAFPLTAEGQAHFFASAIWHDRLAYRPAEVLARLRPPVLVLTGAEDPLTPAERHLPEIRRALEGAATEDVTVCMLAGRTRHAFTPDALGLIADWLLARVPPGGAAVTRPGGDAPAVCLEEDFPPA